MSRLRNDDSIDDLERRYLAFQPLLLLSQTIFAGLIALLIATFVGDIASRIKVYKALGTWPEWGQALWVYIGMAGGALSAFYMARCTAAASHRGLRILTLALAALLVAQLGYGALRFATAYRLDHTFALDWLPFAAIAIYLLACIVRASVLAFGTDTRMAAVLSISPAADAWSWTALRRAFGLPVVADHLEKRRWQVAIAILLSTVALAWLPFAALSGTAGMPFAVDSITLVCPVIVDAIKEAPQVVNEAMMKQFGWSRAPTNAADCINAVLPQQASFGSPAWFGKWGWGFAGFVGPVVFGVLAWRFARSRIRFSIDELTRSDPRPPVLFLRPFADDQVTIESERRSILQATLETGRNANTLDEVILDEATAMGPVVALGNPRDAFPPYGAARNYFADKDWQQAVHDLCRDAAAIVIVMDGADNVIWEIQHIFGNGQQDKTLFLLHPRIAGPLADETGRQRVQAAILAMIGDRPEAPDLSGDDLLGFYFSAGGRTLSLHSSTRSRAAYLLAARSFFRSRARH